LKREQLPEILIMKKLIPVICLLATAFYSYAGDTLRVLFIGNSYTDVNNLPEVVRRLASAGGDSLYYKASTPGGYTLYQHLLTPATTNLVAQGGWDYVVLQEQSQLPSFEDGQVAIAVYPNAKKMDSLIHHYSPCAKTVFYMTWGRKNGDASNCAAWPPVCTYLGMDSLLQLRYTIMAEQNNAMISPVAKVWRRLRSTTGAPELYQSDESHPTAAGTYAAAVSFYSLLFGKDPVNNSYNFSLSAAQANVIKAAAKTVVFDSLAYWKRFYPLPAIDSFSAVRTGSVFQFTPVNPRNILGYSWSFGDGTPNSIQSNPSHTFGQTGSFNVCVAVYGSCDTVTYCRTVTTGTVGIAGPDPLQDVVVAPNPIKDRVLVNGLQAKTEYVIFNQTGVAVLKGALVPKNNVIQLGALPVGTYFIRLYDTAGAVKVLKLVKE
jgi:hypothetical protein